VKKLILNYCTVLALFSFVVSNSQQNYWIKSSIKKTKNLKRVHRASFPKTYQVFNLNIEKFKSAIKNAPLRGENSGKSNVYVYFPTADGKLEKFAVSNSPIMESALAAKYPMITTYKAVGIDDATATMRFSLTQFGLHTMSLSGKRGSIYIDPLTADGNFYMVYKRSALGQDLQGFECLTDQSAKLNSLTNEPSYEIMAIDDMKLRTYRLAQTCNGEYGAIFAGNGTDAQKKANIQAQMVLTINRVNEVYERDLAITLVFIAQNDQLIYYDPATDPWNGEFSTKTQEVISTTLNNESLYDIGHNFNTSIGGSGGCLACVCLDGAPPYVGDQKGRGYTGRPDPTGDPFDIDYVAHEMGHQFDAWHSMNTCSRSGNGITEVEPASGSSIMGYAGICATNVQLNSDAHFNYVNIRDISANIQPGGTSDCGAQMTLTNKPPVASAGNDYTIPPSTAYVLRGTATDPDGTASLTYNWSPNDPSRAPTDGAPQDDWTTGPMYRSILPTVLPDRYMPSYSNVVAGNLTPTWEVTPAVARTMNFSFIVRDNGSGFANGIGQTDADLMVVTVENAPPFTVVTPPIWGAGSTQMVKWNVGNTNNNTINCQTVNIKFSTDGGITFPTILAAGVPNDGLETITVPLVADTNTARVMVEAADNIFYALSDNFPMLNAPAFVLQSAVANRSACNIDAVSYEIDFFTANGFNETTTFSATGNPAGSTVAFSPATINAEGQTTMNISGLLGSTAGNYTLTVTGTSASEVKTVDVFLSVVNGLCASIANTTFATSTTLVQFNTINNTSGKPSGYSNYTAISTVINKDSTYDLVVNQNTDGNNTCFTTVWIDWNQNCIFETNEAYDLGLANNTPNGPTSNSPLAVTVPSNAFNGNTIMRVTTKFNSQGTACENAHDAEVEDYTINVQPSLPVAEFGNLEGLTIYPNPNSGSFNVKLNSVSDNKIDVTVFDIRGRRVFNTTYIATPEFNKRIDLNRVQSGMYLLQISDGLDTITKKVIVN